MQLLTMQPQLLDLPAWLWLRLRWTYRERSLRLLRQASILRLVALGRFAGA